MLLQSLVNPAHTRAPATRENQSADVIFWNDHVSLLLWNIVTRAGGGCHRDP